MRLNKNQVTLLQACAVALVDFGYPDATEHNCTTPGILWMFTKDWLQKRANAGDVDSADLLLQVAKEHATPPVKTYTSRSNAVRAGRTAAMAAGTPQPLAGVHFRVNGDDAAGYTVELVDQATGSVVVASDLPTAPPALDPVFDTVAGKAAGVAALDAGATVQQAQAAALHAATSKPKAKAAPAAPVLPAPQTRGAQLAAKQRADEGKVDAAKAPRGEARFAEAVAQAQAGHMPEPPVFSGASGAPYAKRLQPIIDAAKAGDVAALQAFKVSTTVANTRIVQMARYRDLAVLALQAKAK